MAKVKKIYPIGIEDVYNMEVSGYHNFAANGGFIVHNCDAIRAFVVNWTSPSVEKKIRVPVSELSGNYDITELEDKGYKKYELKQWQKKYKTRHRFTF
jgi:hypothetical protein